MHPFYVLGKTNNERDISGGESDSSKWSSKYYVNNNVVLKGMNKSTLSEYLHINPKSYHIIFISIQKLYLNLTRRVRSPC